MRLSLALLLFLLANTTYASECVVLLHGLARTSASMEDLETSFEQAGFTVANIDYPSRKHTIEDLAEIAVGNGLKTCEKHKPNKIHFVTHSLGGILIRQYLTTHRIENLGRTVMLGPPNKGSEVVDKLKNVPGFRFINGPAGLQLGTGSQSVPESLGPANFEVGIISGTRSINLFLSMLIPSTDDGKVSIESAHLENEKAFLEMPVTHPFMMKNTKVIDNVIHFIQHGAFKEDESEK